MIRLYGVPGCGPCEVAKLWLRQKGLDFDFVDLSRDEEALARVRAILGSARGGVVLERDGQLEAMLGVSPAKLDRWYRALGGGQEGAARTEAR